MLIVTEYTKYICVLIAIFRAIVQFCVDVFVVFCSLSFIFFYLYYTASLFASSEPIFSFIFEQSCVYE